MSDTHADTAADADADAAETVASAVAAAPFVHLFGHADGDSVAACGLLAVALRERAVPFRVSIAADPTEAAAATDTKPEAAESRTLVVGADRDNGLAVPATSRQPASVAAATISRTLGVDPDPVLALAGVVAAGKTPGQANSQQLVERAEAAGHISRRPGVALPTTDLTDLAHSTRLSAPFSGDRAATTALLEEVGVADAETLDAEQRTRFASTVAVETATADAASAVAADSVEQSLRPYATPNGPFATLGGYADVLSALACRSPGLAVALAFESGAVEDALDCWREHAAATHAALTDPITGRYDGEFVSRVGTAQPAVLPTVARLTHQFHSPEPVTIVVTEELVDGCRHAAVVASEPQGLAGAAATVASEFDGESGGTATQATLQVGDVAADQLVAALREVIG